MSTSLLVAIVLGWLATQEQTGMVLGLASGYAVLVNVVTIALEPWLNAYKLVDPRCLKCGYDLRASPLRCPECGAAVAIGAGDHARGQVQSS